MPHTPGAADLVLIRKAKVGTHPIVSPKVPFHISCSRTHVLIGSNVGWSPFAPSKRIFRSPVLVLLADTIKEPLEQINCSLAVISARQEPFSHSC